MKKGCGVLKGLAAVTKRTKAVKTGGVCGENRRTFVDEVVLLTKQNAPLIGVRYWSDVATNVKKDIAGCAMVWH